MGDAALWLVERTANELLLFALAGLLVGGLDDLLVDLIWLWRALWKRIAFHRNGWVRTYVPNLPAPQVPGRLAVFVGAWDEAAVIGNTLRTALERWRGVDFRLYVGLYPNDPATCAIVRRIAREDDRIVPVVGVRDGPTSKAEALNRCWRAMGDFERASGARFKAVVLHDAEDLVHRDEPTVFTSLIEQLDFIQLPVLPLPDAASRWVGGHYQDEFAEAHGKQMIVREWIGAGVPAAGTGCAIARAPLQSLADAHGGDPFDDTSLTEDYEMGVRLGVAGWRVAFVSVATRPGGKLVAVRSHFPARYGTAVRQKARWICGIAFSGWDKLGWSGGLAETWMRLRDRRAPLAALVIAAGYLGMALLAVAVVARLRLGLPVPASLFWRADWIGVAVALLLLWRMLMRFAFVTHFYGRREGVRSIPRLFVANAILIGSVARAMVKYVRRDAGWDKTDHTHHAVPAE